MPPTGQGQLFPEPSELRGEQQKQPKLPERFLEFLTQGPGRGGGVGPFRNVLLVSSFQELSTAY